jgi:hypothetical protein
VPKIISKYEKRVPLFNLYVVVIIRRYIIVVFLPEFIKTFILSRHGISALELDEAVAGLRAFPFIPDTAVILDQKN